MQPLPFRERGKGGWFTIPGIQDGERTLEEGIRGIEVLRHEAKGATVLDLGCAEGLIARWFIEAGARSADGLDCDRRALALGHALAERRDGRKLHLWWADFDDPATWPGLKADYDIVLCLSVLHKLKAPEPLLDFAIGKARRWLAVRAPARTLKNSFAIKTTIEEAGFRMVSEVMDIPWVGIFRRCT